MRVSKITFGKIKAQYELLKMRAAYIMAEDFIVNREVQEDIMNLEQDGEWTFTTTMTPEEFSKFDMFKNNRHISEKEIIHEKLLILEKQLKEAEEREQYESCHALLQAIKLLRKKFTQL